MTGVSACWSNMAADAPAARTLGLADRDAVALNHYATAGFDLCLTTTAACVLGCVVLAVLRCMR